MEDFFTKEHFDLLTRYQNQKGNKESHLQIIKNNP